MDRVGNLKSTDVQAMLRLTNRLHGAQDPISRKRRMLEGLCELVGGSAGACIVMQRDAATDRAAVVSLVEHHASTGPGGDHDGHAPTAPSASLSSLSASLAARDGEAGLSLAQALHSVLKLPGNHAAAHLVLVGTTPAQGDPPRRFRARQRRMVDLFHGEMMWVYQADVVLASSDARALSPRERQTLEHLLAGRSEKEIAASLHLSHNTVHHYVKSIHRHFRVSSRSELLARWVGK